jgi:hypothetical protein
MGAGEGIAMGVVPFGGRADVKPGALRLIPVAAGNLPIAATMAARPETITRRANRPAQPPRRPTSVAPANGGGDRARGGDGG